jgi:hypothetical protein
VQQAVTRLIETGGIQTLGYRIFRTTNFDNALVQIEDEDDFELLVTGAAKTSEVQEVAEQFSTEGRLDEVVDELTATAEVEAIATELWATIQEDSSFREALDALLASKGSTDDEVGIGEQDSQQYLLFERVFKIYAIMYVFGAALVTGLAFRQAMAVIVLLAAIAQISGLSVKDVLKKPPSNNDSDGQGGS